MVHGYQGPYVGYIPANNALNIPALTLEDGPQGTKLSGIFSLANELININWSLNLSLLSL